MRVIKQNVDYGDVDYGLLDLLDLFNFIFLCVGTFFSSNFKFKLMYRSFDLVI